MQPTQTTSGFTADLLRDEFLSEEDLDLRNLSEAELMAYWNLWLQQAQATNDLDQFTYSHGVFENAPAPVLPPTDAPELFRGHPSAGASTL